MMISFFSGHFVGVPESTHAFDCGQRWSRNIQRHRLSLEIVGFKIGVEDRDAHLLTLRMIAGELVCSSKKHITRKGGNIPWKQ